MDSLQHQSEWSHLYPQGFVHSGHIKDQLVTQLFQTWQKISEKYREHEQCQYHQDAFIQTRQEHEQCQYHQDAFIQTRQEHEQCQYHQDALIQARQAIHSIGYSDFSISALDTSHGRANIVKIRVVLKSISRETIFCGRRCIALQGDAKNLETTLQYWQFSALLKLLSFYNGTIKYCMESPAMWNATNMSPRTQLEITEVTRKCILWRQIVKEVKAAKFYVASHNTEHFALCAKFVDNHKDIQ